MRFVPIVLLLPLLACGDKETPASGGLDTATLCATDYTLTWDNFGSSFFATYCDSCHAASSPNRFGAPEDATFDTEQEVIDQYDAVWSSVIETEWMPLGGGVYEEDLEQLTIYMVCSL